MNKLKVGVLLDSFLMSNWQSKMLEEISKSNYAEISVVILNTRVQSTPDERLRKSKWYKLYQRLEKIKLKFPLTAVLKSDVSQWLSTDPLIEIRPSLDQGKSKLSALEVGSIEKYQLDVIINLAFLNLDGGLHKLAKHGIWSVSFGAGENSPAGFWEVLGGHPFAQSQVTIQNSSAPQIAYRSFSPVMPFSVSRTSEFNYWKSASFIPRLLRRLHSKGPSFLEIPDVPLDEASTRNKEFPNILARVGIVVDFIIKYINEKIFNRLFTEQWVLLFNISDDLNYDFANYQLMLPPKDKFWADPFVLHRDGKYYIYIEESYSDKRKKGFISLIIMDEQGNYQSPAKLIEHPYHMSYPFIFEWKDHLYMIPESNANRTIQIYKCQEEPHKWEFHKNLMEDVVAVDTTLLFYNNRWWLFTNQSANKGSSTWDELFLYYADEPMSDHWEPHPKNPIVSDLRRARPAGKIFQQQGRIYRPSQNCSVRYGYGLNIQEVTVLTEDDYQEKEAASFIPNWDSKIRGLHTINRGGRLTVIDAILRTSKF